MGAGIPVTGGAVERCWGLQGAVGHGRRPLGHQISLEGFKIRVEVAPGDMV